MQFSRTSHCHQGYAAALEHLCGEQCGVNVWMCGCVDVMNLNRDTERFCIVWLH